MKVKENRLSPAVVFNGKEALANKLFILMKPFPSFVIIVIPASAGPSSLVKVAPLVLYIPPKQLNIPKVIYQCELLRKRKHTQKQRHTQTQTQPFSLF